MADRTIHAGAAATAALVLALSAAPAAAPQRGGFTREQTDRETRTLPLGPTGTLELKNFSGPVTVTAGGGREVTLEIIRIARGRTDADAKTGLADVHVEVDQRGDRATITSRYPENRRGRQPYDVSVTYNVTAPAGTHVTISSFSGDVSVKGITGDIAVDVLSGAIAITGAQQLSKVHSLSGTITITDVTTDGNVDVDSISGDMTLERVKARQVNANGTSGNVIARDIRAESAKLTTMNGTVEFSGTLSANGRYELQTFNGIIRCVLSGGSGFDLQATTFSGQIKPDANLALQNVRATRTSLRATVGNGGPVVVLKTFSGDVFVSRK